MTERRGHCPTTVYPICAGQVRPADCSGISAERLAQMSRWESSLFGWPGAIKAEPLEARESGQQSAISDQQYAAGGCCPGFA